MILPRPISNPRDLESAKASKASTSLSSSSSLLVKTKRIAEILEELPKLTEEERDELRSRLDEYDPGFLAILQERVRGIESGERETIPADQVIAEGRRLAKELAQQ